MLSNSTSKRGQAFVNEKIEKIIYLIGLMQVNMRILEPTFTRAL